MPGTSRTTRTSNTATAGASSVAGDFSGHGLACIRGERVVFRRLDFSLSAGEAILLLGRNGSGKSSLLRVMAGLVPLAAGQLCRGGVPLGEARDDHAAETRYIGHADAIKPVLTVAENISFWMQLWQPELAGRGGPRRVIEALERFGMAALAEVPGRFLSAGQKRRVNLARLFAAPGKLWLLDEPTTALDKASVEVLEQEIARHRAGGGMVVLSTHTEVRLPAAQTLQMERFTPPPAIPAAAEED